MDRIEQKLDETLKMLSEDPPETLGNQVMASLRSQKPSKNRSFVWIGLVAGCALAVAVTAGIIFTGPKKNADVAVTSTKMADESAKDSYGVAVTPPVTEPGSVAGGSANNQASPKQTENNGSDSKANPGKTVTPKPESRPATKEELDELNKPIGTPSPKQLAQLPLISMTSVSLDPWKAWAECVFQTNGLASNVKIETLTKDDKMPGNKKTYKMTALISRINYNQWLTMAKKTASTIINPQALPAQGDLFNITIIFEPKK
jgi:hypothetical protein